MIHKKYVNIVFAFYMAAMMAFLMSCVLVAVNSGIGGNYVLRVLKSYAIAMPIAFCCVLLVRPIAVWLTNKTLKP